MSSAGFLWVQISPALSFEQFVFWWSGQADGQCVWLKGSGALQEPAGGSLDEVMPLAIVEILLDLRVFDL